MAGIVGYGAYIPRHRIKVEEIAKVWGADAPSYKKGLDARGEVRARARPGHDHDVRRGGAPRPARGPGSIPARSARSTSARNRIPTRSSRRGTVVAEAIGATPDVPLRRLRVRLQGGHARRCSSPSAWSRPGEIKYGLAIGADTSQGAPGDALEYSASAGAAAFIIGRGQPRRRVLRHLLLHDRHAGLLAPRVPVLPPARRPLHRRAGLLQARHRRCARAIMEKAGMKPAGLRVRASSTSPTASSRCGRARSSASRSEQIEPGWLVPTLGNTYSGASPLGLTAILDVAKPGDLILMRLLRLGRGQRRLHLHASPTGSTRCSDLAPQTREHAGREQDLPRVRRVRQVPRQDPEGGIGGDAMRDVAVIGVGMNKWGELWEKSLRDALRRGRARAPSTTPAWTTSTPCTSAA